METRSTYVETRYVSYVETRYVSYVETRYVSYVETRYVSYVETRSTYNCCHDRMSQKEIKKEKQLERRTRTRLMSKQPTGHVTHRVMRQ